MAGGELVHLAHGDRVRIKTRRPLPSFVEYADYVVLVDDASGVARLHLVEHGAENAEPGEPEPEREELTLDELGIGWLDGFGMGGAK